MFKMMKYVLPVREISELTGEVRFVRPKSKSNLVEIHVEVSDDYPSVIHRFQIFHTGDVVSGVYLGSSVNDDVPNEVFHVYRIDVTEQPFEVENA